MSVFNITITDLENATSPQAMIGAFDDQNIGAPSPAPVAAAVDRAEQEVLSWLVDELGPAPFSATVLAEIKGDPFLKYAAIEYCVALMYDRKPEYFKSSMDDIQERFKRADMRMKRVLDARQRPPTIATPPANVGGVSVDNANRLYVDSADGTQNSGDY